MLRNIYVVAEENVFVKEYVVTCSKFSDCLRGVFHIILDTFLKLKNIVM